MTNIIMRDALDEILTNFKDLYTRVQQLEAAPLITSGSGGGAPVDAQYLVTSLNASLTQERLIDVNSGLTYTDFGANNNFQIDLGTPSNVTSVSTNSVTASSHTHALDTLIGSPGTYGNATNVAQVTVDAKGRLTAVSNVAISGVTPAPHALLGAYHSDTATDSPSRGSLIYGNAIPNWDELAHPGSLYHLQTTSLDVGWSQNIQMATSSWIGVGSSSPRIEFDNLCVNLLDANVGINISPPISTLHVYENTTSTGTATGITIEQDGSGDAQLQFLLTGGQRWVIGVDNSDSDRLKIGRGSGWVTATPMIIDTNNRVGIGTNAFAIETLLQVRGPSGSPGQARITNYQGYDVDIVCYDTADAGSIFGISPRGGLGTLATNTRSLVVGVNAAYPLYLGTNGAIRQTITSAGRVGINTMSPAAQTHIDQSGTAAAIPVLTLDQADLSEEFINFVSTIGTGYPINTTSLGSYYGRVRVAVNGTFKWLALYN